MTVITEATPNPNAMKFISNKQIFQGDASISVMPDEISEYDVLNQLMKLEEVDNVFGYKFFITINKHAEIKWEDIIPKVRAIMEKHGY